MRMPFGFGIALAQAASSPIHAASSRRTGAPWAAKMTGIRPPTGSRSDSVPLAMVDGPPLAHAAATNGSAPSAIRALLRVRAPSDAVAAPVGSVVRAGDFLSPVGTDAARTPARITRAYRVEGGAERKPREVSRWPGGTTTRPGRASRGWNAG